MTGPARNHVEALSSMSWQREVSTSSSQAGWSVAARMRPALDPSLSIKLRTLRPLMRSAQYLCKRDWQHLRDDLPLAWQLPNSSSDKKLSDPTSHTRLPSPLSRLSHVHPSFALCSTGLTNSSSSAHATVVIDVANPNSFRHLRQVAQDHERASKQVVNILNLSRQKRTQKTAISNEQRSEHNKQRRQQIVLRGMQCNDMFFVGLFEPRSKRLRRHSQSGESVGMPPRQKTWSSVFVLLLGPPLRGVACARC